MMSIRDGKGAEIVRLPGMWETLAKFAFASSIPVLMLGVSWAVWVTSSINNHATDIAVIRAQMDSKGITQSVNVGDASKATAQSQRDYLTVSDVAARENVSERTIISWIEADRLEPRPVKAGKEWTVSAKYRIIPHHAASFGIQSRPEEEVEVTP